MTKESKALTDAELIDDWNENGDIWEPLDYAIWANEMCERLQKALAHIADLELRLDNAYAESMGDDWFGRD